MTKGGNKNLRFIIIDSVTFFPFFVFHLPSPYEVLVSN